MGSSGADSDIPAARRRQQQQKRKKAERTASASRSRSRRRGHDRSRSRSPQQGAAKNARATSAELWNQAKNLRDKLQSEKKSDENKKVGQPVFFRGNKSQIKQEEVKIEENGKKKTSRNDEDMKYA